MKNSLLIAALKTLTTAERRRFLELSQSDYWHKNDKVRALIRHLLSLAPAYQLEKLDRTQLWRKLYAPRPFNEAALNNYLSDALQLLYDFLSLESFREQESMNYDLLQGQLITRGLLHHAERCGKKWAKTQAKSNRRDAAYFQSEFRRVHHLDQLALRKSRRSFSEFLQEKSEQLDLYYVIAQLENYAEMLSRGNIVKGGYQLHYLDELFGRFDRNELAVQAIPSATIYTQILRMFQGDTPEQRFHQLTELFRAHHNVFRPTDLRAIYNYLLNYCVKQINSGRTDYYRQIFSLYQLLIQQDLIAPNGRLSQWTYTNIITTGIRLGEFDWTEEFLANYQTYLPAKQRHNAYQYNLAALRFEKQAYNEALEQLHQIEFTDAFYHMAAKLVQLKIYFLQEEDEALAALIEATRQFISRNRQLSEYQQRINLNFLKILLKINQLRGERRRQKAERWQEPWTKTQQQLQQADFPVSNKDWLLEILAAIDTNE